MTQVCTPLDFSRSDIAFDNAAIDFSMVETCIAVDDEQASNWQATYWKHKTKEDRELEAMLARIRLGILPPLIQAEADAAIEQAQEAAVAASVGAISPERQLYEAMEARRRYEDAYASVYKEAYIAAHVAERWREDMRKRTNRRKALLLLLH